MDRRYDFVVHVEHPGHAGGFDVPAALILESHALLELGCPGDSAYECAPAFYAALADLDTLEELARDVGDAREDERAIARWADDGGAPAA